MRKHPFPWSATDIPYEGCEFRDSENGVICDTEIADIANALAAERDALREEVERLRKAADLAVRWFKGDKVASTALDELEKALAQKGGGA